jgi:hypothetical protein
LANPAFDIFPFRTNICEGCEGSEASTEKTYQHSDSNLRREMDDNLLNYKLKERHTHPRKPSQPSQASHLSQPSTKTEILTSILIRISVGKHG